MAFRPDILITTPEGLALVAEVKVGTPNLEHTEQQLKEYMVRMQCPIGLVVTPERLWLYRDSYRTRSAESIQRVGDFDIKQVWRDTPPLQEAAFETFVQQWLERLSKQSTDEFSKDLREALQEYVLPAVATGDVRAAHPRYA